MRRFPRISCLLLVAAVLPGCALLKGKKDEAPAAGAPVQAGAPAGGPAATPVPAAIPEPLPKPSVSNEFRATHSVVKKKAVLLLPGLRGSDSWANSRETFVETGTGVEVLSSAPPRAMVRVADGRRGYMFVGDIEQVPDVSALVGAGVPIFPDDSAVPGFPVARDPEPSVPIDPELIEQANDLLMPSL